MIIQKISDCQREGRFDINVKEGSGKVEIRYAELYSQLLKAVCIE